MEKWEVRTGGDSGKDPNAHDVYVQGGVERIAKLPWCQKDRASLIAAAPVLLAALREIRNAILNEEIGKGRLIAIANVAIAIAEGK